MKDTQIIRKKEISAFLVVFMLASMILSHYSVSYAETTQSYDSVIRSFVVDSTETTVTVSGKVSTTGASLDVNPIQYTIDGSYTDWVADQNINLTISSIVTDSHLNNGGSSNKITKLSNGWLIVIAHDSSYINIFVSKDYGRTFSPLCKINTGSNLSGWALTSSGTIVYILTSGPAAIVKFDAATITPGTILNQINIDSGQIAAGPGASIILADDGTLHAVWCSKNSTYSSSYNIRYSSSTNGGITWSPVEQISKLNASGQFLVRPHIAISNGSPVILAEWDSDSPDIAIMAIRRTPGVTNDSSHFNTNWSCATVYNAGAYTQTNPVILVDSNGLMHVAWQGKDSIDTNYYNIRYSKSVDGGKTWTQSEKLTSGNIINRITPTLFLDIKGNLCLVYDENGNLKYIKKDTALINEGSNFISGSKQITTLYRYYPGGESIPISDYTGYPMVGNNTKFSIVCNGLPITRHNLTNNQSNGYQYIYSGTNSYNLVTNIPKETWFEICFSGGNGTTGVYISGLKLVFSDNNEMTIKQAIDSGLISPLCLISSGYNGFQWSNWMALYDGNQINSGSYPTAYTTIKTRSNEIKAIKFYSNVSFDTRYDGLSVYSFPGLELSYTPIQMWTPPVDILRGNNPIAICNTACDEPIIIYDNGANINFYGYQTINRAESFTIEGLTPPNTSHTAIFTVKLADGTTESAIRTIYTKAHVPNITASAISTGGILVEVSHENPSKTDYQVMIDNTYVSSTGAISLEPCWIKLSDYKAIIKGTTYKSTYTIKARARNGDGFETAWSPLQSIIHQFANPPGFGTIRNVAPGSISVNWTDGGNPVGTLYKVAAFDTDVNTLIKESAWTSDLSCLINGLQTNKTYTIKAIAKNENQIESDWSEIGSITTSFEAPVLSTTPHALSVDLSWSRIDGAYLYELEIDGVVKQIKLLNSYIHENLDMGSLHTYRIRAKTINGWSEWSEVYPVITLASPPSCKPTNIRVVATNLTATLSWDRLPDAEGYEIAEYDGTNLATPIPVEDSLSCEIEGLSPNSTHIYKVRATNSLGYGEWSDPVSIMTFVLETPNNVDIFKYDTSLKFFWNSVPNALSYEISLTNASGASIHSSNGTSLEITGLTPETEYMYSIRAINSIGSSAWKDEATVVTNPIIPSIPENVFAVINKNTIIIRWDPVNAAEGYDVEIDGVLLENDNTTEYAYKDLEPNSVYSYRVRARNSAIEGEWSLLKTIRTLPGKPSVPNVTDVKSSQTGSLLIWQRVPGALNYDVEISLRENDPSPKIIRSIEGTSYLHRKLITGAEYRYRIRSRNREGVSSWSGYIINNSIKAKCTKKETLDLGLTATDVTDFTPYTMVVTYNSGVLDVIDFCSITGEYELNAGKIEGTEVTVTSFTPGKIVFTVDKVMNDDEAWTGIINSIKYKARFTGGTTITYTVFCKSNEEL